MKKVDKIMNLLRERGFRVSVLAAPNLATKISTGFILPIFCQSDEVSCLRNQ